MQVAVTAGQALLPGFQNSPVYLQETQARQSSRRHPLAALRCLDREIQFSKVDCQALLLELNRSACFFKLFLEALSVVFRSTFFDG